MTLKLPKYKIEDGITQSMLQAFMACRQRSAYQLDHWEPLGAVTASADRGNLFHFLLEKWYRDRPTSGESWLDTAISFWKAKLSKNGPLPAFFEEAENLALALFEPYVTKWKKSDDTLQWESLEEVFDVTYKGFRLRGKIDGLPIRKGRRWIFETKTKAAIDEEGILDTLLFDFQNLFYLTMLRELGRPAIGVIYNIIRTPNFRKKETAQERIARMKDDAQKNSKDYFIRYEVTYPKETVERFEQELLWKLELFKAVHEGKQPVFRNETACITRMKCPFLKACASGSMIGYQRTRKLFRELEE